jgi:IS5 family transposase
MAGLQYLRALHNLSDQDTLEHWCENPYWQYFCGMTHFQHVPPTDQTTMSSWRKRVAKAGAEELLAETIQTGLRAKIIKPAELARVNLDTTVQPKNIRFPTDARLYERCCERLAKQARREHIPLRQSYARVNKKLLRKQSGYARARHFKRAQNVTRKLKTHLRAVVSDLLRKSSAPSPALRELLTLAQRLLVQKRDDKNKLYSVHEPQVECIAKGKAQAPYEFGVKAGIVSTSTGNWITGAQAFAGNPYDGHTLSAALAQSERLCGHAHTQAFCDLGYRGHGHAGPCEIQVVNRFRKNVSRRLLRWWRRRNAIEPVIGHMKSGHGLGRNMLGGVLGDAQNVLFAALGFNLRKLLRALACLLSLFVTLPARVFASITYWVRLTAARPVLDPLLARVCAAG